MPETKKARRKPRKDLIENLQRIESGGNVNRHNLQSYIERGLIKVKHVPVVELTKKGRELVG